MGLEPETFDILQLTGLWWNLRNLPVICSFLRNTCAFLPPCFRIFLAHWKKSWMHSPCRKKDIYLCSAQVDMVVIKGIVQSHCHHILDKTKSLSVASWLLLPIIVIHLVIGPAYYLFVIFSNWGCDFKCGDGVTCLEEGKRCDGFIDCPKVSHILN